MVLGAGQRQLRRIRVEDQARLEVRKFVCGTEPYALPVAEFLTSGNALAADQSGESQTWVMEEDGRIVAFVNTFRTELSYPKWNGKQKLPALGIAWLGVATGEQGRGIAKQILQSVIVQANDDASLDVVYLLVDERNPAIRLYTNIGFVDHPTRPQSVQDDAKHRRMTLKLVR